MHQRTFIALALGLSFASAHAQSVSVLGLTLGARPERPLQVCGPEARLPCWVHTPLSVGAERTGTVQLPDHWVPEWAAGGTYTVNLDPRNRVGVLSVETAGSERNYKRLMESISARFGPPSSTWDQGGTYLVRWERPGVTIEYLNGQGASRVVFKSRPEDIESARALGSDVLRPPTP